MQGLQTIKRMKSFLIIWFGQLISIIGSGLTGFGLSVWIYEQTGQALPIALNALFVNLPRVLLAPFAGAIADRYDRRSIMILADIGAAVATLGVVVMLLTGRLEVWHIYTFPLSSVLHSAHSKIQPIEPQSLCWCLKKIWLELAAWIR